MTVTVTLIGWSLLRSVHDVTAPTVGWRSASQVAESTGSLACWATCSVILRASRSLVIGRASVVMPYLTLLPSTDVTVAMASTGWPSTMNEQRTVCPTMAWRSVGHMTCWASMLCFCSWSMIV